MITNAEMIEALKAMPGDAQYSPVAVREAVLKPVAPQGKSLTRGPDGNCIGIGYSGPATFMQDVKGNQ